MKKVFFISGLLVLFSLINPVSSLADDIPLGVGEVDPPIGNPFPKSPVLVPTTSLDGYTFYLNGDHPDYVVRLLDEDDNVVYQTVMPSTVSSIVLPSSLSGYYQIQLI